MHEVRLDETDLGLVRVHIDIDVLWRERQEHEHHRVTLLRESMAICFRKGM
jgi:hypothetical protein